MQIVVIYLYFSCIKCGQVNPNLVNMKFEQNFFFLRTKNSINQGSGVLQFASLFGPNYNEVSSISYDFYLICQTGLQIPNLSFSRLVHNFLNLLIPLHVHSVHNAVSPGAKS